MTEQQIVAWREVAPLGELDGALDQVLASVDTLRGAWEAFAASVSPDDFAEARRRSLRRHAIETGIIERLYDVEWGVTEALVAEGLTLEVAEREGGIDEDALTTIRTQFDALEFLASAAWRDPLRSVRSVRESYCPVVGKEDNRSDGTCETPAHAGADHQEVA